VSPLRSMTGYGAAAVETSALRAAVTIRSLNHRFLELGLSLSRRVASLEPEVKALVQSRVSRGKVDVGLKASFPGSGESSVAVVPAVVAGAVQALREARQRHGLAGEVSVSDIARFPGAFEVVETSESLDEDRKRGVLGLIDEALQGLEAMRRSEGERLCQELELRLAAIEAAAERVEALSAEGKAHRRDTLLARVRDLASELGADEARLYAEVVRTADRLDVSEEVQRLRSHVSLARELLGSDAPAGKRLDFVAQELAREANTIGSKAAFAPLVQEVVALKGEIEKLREQVQNVE
jgi:uncharacterized protein (TIGR00255 family)